MISTPKGAVLSTRELILLQVILEEAIVNFDAIIEGHTPAVRAEDRTIVDKHKKLAKDARLKWRHIEKTHIARQARRPR